MRFCKSWDCLHCHLTRRASEGAGFLGRSPEAPESLVVSTEQSLQRFEPPNALDIVPLLGRGIGELMALATGEAIAYPAGVQAAPKSPATVAVELPARTHIHRAGPWEEPQAPHVAGHGQHFWLHIPGSIRPGEVQGLVSPDDVEREVSLWRDTVQSAPEVGHSPERSAVQTTSALRDPPTPGCPSPGAPKPAAAITTHRTPRFPCYSSKSTLFRIGRI